ncbi:heparinase II/III-family protein [Kribbella sp. NBC_01245]|uniref:heparinase II/III domain-containing protein n=1 Tax=Kribbella sp. NBC_01245 TaxID=2903578 RepID=UPI002E2D1EDB|nr:heparinase II/III family protein [Kribbella sp. NBC_01245]
MTLTRRWFDLGEPVRAAALGHARARVGVPDVGDRAAWETCDPETAAAIAAEASRDAGVPWPGTFLSDYARYWRDGVRTAYEGPAGDVRRRTSAAVLAAALTGEEKHLDQAADGLLLLCEQTSWCWAAHESFASERKEVVPDPDHPYLDLGAAETVSILAWADLALASALDRRVPGLRRRLREEARRRVIRPFLEDRRWHWLGLDGHLHNWNPWIHGQLLAATLLLETDSATKRAVVELTIDGLDRYLAALPADGGCDEGYAYWWNGPARLAEALELLDRVTGGEFAPWDIAPLAELARYPQRMALGEGWYVNVGDGPARPDPDQPWHVLHRWGGRIGDHDVRAQAAAHRGQAISAKAGLGRALTGLLDDDWMTAQPAVQPAAQPAALPLPASSWLPDVQLLVSREQAGTTKGLALAIKGGHNAENHNHNDVGSYVVAVDGTPVLIDLGQPTYTSISFSERRYEQWVVRSEWHNLPLIAGHEQPAGAQWRASEVDVRLTPEGDSFSADLSTAYPTDARWRRTATLDRQASTVRVHDEWENADHVTLHHVLAGRPIAHHAGELTVETLAGAKAKAKARLTWAPHLGQGRLEKRTIDDPLLSDVWGPAVHRLVIDLGPNQTSFDLTITTLKESPRVP